MNNLFSLIVASTVASPKELLSIQNEKADLKKGEIY